MFLRPVEELIPLCIAMLISLTLHEWAHAWTAYRLGDNTAYHEGRVTLNPIVHLDLMGSLVFLLSGGIGWAKPVPVTPSNFRNPRRDDILVTAAGPFSNLLLGILSTIITAVLYSKGILPIHSPSPTAALAIKTLNFMMIVNFMLLFFNLIPLFPLDGFHIVTNSLPLNQAYQFKQFNTQYGSWVLMGLFIMDWSTPFKPLSMLIGPPSQFLLTNIFTFVKWIT